MMAKSDTSDIFLSPAPHMAGPLSTRKIMLTVIAILVPIAAYGVFLFGRSALIVIVVSVVSSVVFEALFRAITAQSVRIGDFSAVITGLLLALILPPTTPVWMVVLGAGFAIIVAKEFFGGLGANVFNPALSGRAFLLISFTGPMTFWLAPGSSAVDAVSAATPLSWIKPIEGAVLTASAIAEKTGLLSGRDLYWNLLMGRHAGSIGESAIFLILIAFIILSLLKIIDWRAPVAMVVSAMLVTGLLGIDPVLTVLSGGLAFGAVFMATDYATTPVTPKGRLLFGAGCGVITALIRVFGGYPEGVMFSILIMNATVPFLNKIIDRKYGYVRPSKKGMAAK